MCLKYIFIIINYISSFIAFIEIKFRPSYIDESFNTNHVRKDYIVYDFLPPFHVIILLCFHFNIKTYKINMRD